MVNFWTVREGAETPNVIRYSVASWRSGTVTVEGIEVLVSAMDANNDAVFNDKDKWSILAATEQDAARRVLSLQEARPVNRLMFAKKGDGKELVLEFNEFSADGRWVSFAAIDRPVTKAEDRAPDDTLAAERARPRAAQAFTWIEGDFDEWIWTDAEVAGVLNAGYVGVKLDGDVAKDLVSRFHVEGYPTMIVLDASGKAIQRFGYLPSKDLAELLRRQP
jgi:hypothetical protein